MLINPEGRGGQRGKGNRYVTLDCYFVHFSIFSPYFCYNDSVICRICICWAKYLRNSSLSLRIYSLKMDKALDRHMGLCVGKRGEERE
jgi:hypothetical protein